MRNRIKVTNFLLVFTTKNVLLHNKSEIPRKKLEKRRISIFFYKNLIKKWKKKQWISLDLFEYDMLMIEIEEKFIGSYTDRFVGEIWIYF